MTRRLSQIQHSIKERGRATTDQEYQLLTERIEEERKETGILALKNLSNLQKLEGSPKVKEVLGMLRRFVPKYFFKCANR